MESSIGLAAIALLILWLWSSAAGIISVVRDHSLDSFQKKAQISVILLLPFLGAVFILMLVNQHSPEAIPKRLFPWPFSLLLGHSSYGNTDRNDRDGFGTDLAVSHRQDNRMDLGGDSGSSD
ncbi:hypothetical protein [Hahella ganghwensis]|uniref:hypothetical protein n=1 Tax=Hahella ganghwensis TaxID=286420 RepID=UPI00035DE4BF|nr:hypothetical protein [Hahella ganghwensis]